MWRYLHSSSSVRRRAAQYGARYKETESSAVREELAKFISNARAPAAKGRVCVGKRATCMSEYAAARHLRHEHWSCDGILHNLKLAGQRAKIAEKILKEIAIV